MKLHSTKWTAGVALAIGCALFLSAAEPTAPDSVAITRLKAFQGLIGPWRGVGQPKRGSNVGAWREGLDSRWDLTKDHVGIVWSVSDGMQWKSAWLAPGDGENAFLLRVTLPDDSVRDYRGKRDGERLVLESAAANGADVHRATLSFLNDNRWTLLLERRAAQQSFYQRVAEIAYQREGTRLAAVDGTGPECVVTGGLGTIAVAYQGKTYYVCCTGCRDAFNDDPEGILRAWAERKQAKADKK